MKAFYFKHSTTETHSLKYRKFIRKCGIEGMGIYWALVEVLIQEGGSYPSVDLDDLADYVYTTPAKLKKVIATLNDLTIENGELVSEYASEKLQEVKERSEKASRAANTRHKKKKSEPLGIRRSSNEEYTAEDFYS